MPRSTATIWKRMIALIAVGSATYAILTAGNQLWLPVWLQPVGALLYRVTYLAALPVYLVVGALSPPVGHHWPAVNWVVTAYVAPVLWWGLLRIYRSARPRARLLPWLRKRLQRRSARRAGGPAHTTSREAEALTRRQILAGAAWGTAVAAGAAVAGYSIAIEPGRLQLRRYRIALAGLPPALAGLRLVHISDTHYGPFVSLPFLERAIAHANQLRPDIVLLTGDYVHRTPRSIEPGIGIFAALRPRIGTLAVLGNHDYWENAQACRAAFREIGIPLIDNARRFVTTDGLAEREPARGIPALCVAGLADLWEDTPSFADALGGVSASTPRILLSHNPDAAESVPGDMRVDLMVCGHTHGGQIRLPLIGAPLVPSSYGEKYAGGMCHGPRCDVLVSRGVGLSILPLRLGVPPEIGLVTLERRKA